MASKVRMVASFSVRADGSEDWSEGYGCVLLESRPPYRVRATRGSGGGVELYVSDPQQANAAFHLLCRCYSDVETEGDEDERYFPKTVLNLGPHEMGAAILDACPCGAMTEIAYGPTVIQRHETLEAIRVARMDKPPRRASLTGQIMPRLRSRILERDNFRCKRCGNDATNTALEVDHIIPRAKGGTNDERNLQTLCWACNRGKSDSDPMPHELEAAS